MLRVETGVRQGDEVSVYYDPMIAKIVVWGIDRQSAVRRLDAALRDTHIAGLKTNVPFVRAVLAHNEFKCGNVYTDFIADHERELFADEWTPTLGVDACIAQLLIDRYSKRIATNDPFDSIDDFRVNLRHRQTIVIGNRSFQLIVNGNDSYSIETTDGVDTVQLIDVQYDARQSVIEFVIADENGNRRQVKAVDTHDGSITLFAENGQIVDWQRPSPKWMHINDDVSGDAGSLAPMPGVIEKIMIGVGDAIKAGQPMVVMVAMKMEYVIRYVNDFELFQCYLVQLLLISDQIVLFRAPRDGIVETILCAQGQNVNKNATLVKLTH
jgi:3-methylcrotonyl-CoA carboxylase alpha subunit